MSINVKNIYFRYNKNIENTINDLNLFIEDGSIVVLLGLNGCGKTTLIKLLAGLLKTSEGEILYNGKSINELGFKERSKVFSYVPQKTYIADDFYVKDYLTYGFVNSLKFYERPKDEQIKKINKISEELGIVSLLDKKMGKISGGERQIVTIASCILQDTPIILLDEPTSALDLKNQNLVLSLLRKIAKEENKTIILSSHNPNHALFLQSDVALMNNGRIIEIGKSKDIIKKEILISVYGKVS